MKNKIPPFFLWLITVLMILTVFFGLAAYAALDQLEQSRQKTVQEQKNLQEQLEFQLLSDDTVPLQPLHGKEYDGENGKDKEKKQQ